MLNSVTITITPKVVNIQGNKCTITYSNTGHINPNKKAKMLGNDGVLYKLTNKETKQVNKAIGYLLFILDQD